jgi:hypothetical protein
MFMDIDTIPPGADFTEVIDEAVSSCDVLIAVIGKQWLTAADSSGKRRLDDAGDFVRLEIKAALERNVRVIPALVQGATFPAADTLPSAIAALALRNAIELRRDNYHQAVARLIAAIESPAKAEAERERAEWEEAKELAREARERSERLERERFEREARKAKAMEQAAREQAAREDHERAAEQARREQERLAAERAAAEERKRKSREKALTIAGVAIGIPLAIGGLGVVGVLWFLLAHFLFELSTGWSVATAIVLSVGSFIWSLLTE